MSLKVQDSAQGSEMASHYAPSENIEARYTWLLAAIQFVHMLDFVIMMPLGPTFMREMAMSPSQFSLLVSAYTFSAGISGFVSSFVADQYNRKRFLLFVFLGFIVGTFFCALSNNFWMMLIARVVAGAFGGVLNACVFALIADLIPPVRRGKATGIVMSSFSMASVIGIPIGLQIARVFGWRYSFIFIVLLSILVLLFASRFIPSIPAPPAKEKSQFEHFKHVLSKPDYIFGFCLTSLLAFGAFMVVPFIAPYFVNNVGFTEAELAWMYLVGGTCTMLSARKIGKLCDQYGSPRILVITLFISIVPVLLLTSLPRVPIPVALVVSSLFMMFVSGRFIPALTLVSLKVSQTDRGTFMSLEGAFRQLASGVAALFSGVLIAQNAEGELTGFGRVGLCSILSVMIAFLVSRRLNRTRP